MTGRPGASVAPVATRGGSGARPRPERAGDLRLPARERAYRELRLRILEGRLSPGTTLLEAEVAALLAMSRTPIREALIRLEDEGLVIVTPRRGFTVRALSLDDLAEIYEVFSALEVRAARLAARRGLDPATAERLSGLLTAMERATARGDIVRWSHLDDDFHAGLVAASGNGRLEATIRQCWDQQYRARMSIVPLRPRPDRSDAEHRLILEAIRARDAEAAERLLGAHRDRADTQTLSLLRGASATGAGS